MTSGEDPIRVRMGLNTGSAVLGGDNYAGLEVVRAARITAAGHGGQVLLSEATAALVAARLPAGMEIDPAIEQAVAAMPSGREDS